MTRENWFDRAYGCLIGQAIGDALGAPTEGQTPTQIEERYGWLEDFVQGDPAGTDDTEYAMLTALTVLKYGHEMTLDDVTRQWQDLVSGQEGGFDRGGFSEMDAVYNLRKGLVAPATGQDNHEMWSDGAAMRIAPIGIFCAGDSAEAARLAGIEARISHDRDGVYCAQALAASVAAAMVINPEHPDAWQRVVDAGLAYIPEDSWTARKIEEALEIGANSVGLKEAILPLYDKISIFYYPWADVGPEATALAYGVFAAARGDYVQTVLGGANIGRDSDTIAAMAGAMAGALHGADAIPQKWRDQINIIRGSCLKVTAGINVAELAGRFANTLTGDVPAGVLS